MMALSGALARVQPALERLDALSLRERLILFGAGMALLCVGWQALLMDPLAARAHQAEQRLAQARHQLAALNELGAAASDDPAIGAALRNRALAQRLAALDAELGAASQGYVSPERMNELLRSLLREQKGLTLVSLLNGPVESLSRPPENAARAGDSKRDEAAHAEIAADDRGPFLHPVEIVVEGDYASVAAYVRALEGLPYRIHWRTLELTTLEYPVNRVRISIGALSLSRHWMSV
jgi:MSHA biogenesis protein MshJ